MNSLRTTTLRCREEGYPGSKSPSCARSPRSSCSWYAQTLFRPRTPRNNKSEQVRTYCSRIHGYPPTPGTVVAIPPQSCNPPDHLSSRHIVLHDMKRDNPFGFTWLSNVLSACNTAMSTSVLLPVHAYDAKSTSRFIILSMTT